MVGVYCSFASPESVYSYSVVMWLYGFIFTGIFSALLE